VHGCTTLVSYVPLFVILHPRPDQLQVRWSDGASTAASEEHATAADQSPGQGGVWHAGYVPPRVGHLAHRALC
jgi:hypothetical protein